MDKKTHNKIAKHLSKHLNCAEVGVLSAQDQILRNSDLIKATKDTSTIATKQKFHVMQGTASTLIFVSGLVDGSYWRSLTGALITGRNKLQHSRLGKAKNSYELSGKEISNNFMSMGTGLPQFIQGVLDVDEASDVLTNKDFLPGSFLLAGYVGAVLNAFVDKDGKQKQYEYRKNAYLRDLQKSVDDNGLSFGDTQKKFESDVKRSKFFETMKTCLEVVPPFLLKCRAIAQTATAAVAGGVIYLKTGAIDVASLLLVSAGAIQIKASDVMRTGNEKFSLKSKWRQENRDVCFEHQMMQMRKMQGARVPKVVMKMPTVYIKDSAQHLKDTHASTVKPAFYNVAPLDLSDYCEVTPYEYRQEIDAPRDEDVVRQRLRVYQAI